MVSAFPMLVKCFQQQWNGLSDLERESADLDSLGAAGVFRPEENVVSLWTALLEFRDKKTKKIVRETGLQLLTIKFDPEPKRILRFLDTYQ